VLDSSRRSIISSRGQITRHVACGSETRKSELGKPMEATPDVPTAFEAQVQRLGLNEQTCATSEKLKQWCERNKDRCYIPESLLKRWGIQVDPNLSG